MKTKKFNIFYYPLDSKITTNPLKANWQIDVETKEEAETFAFNRAAEYAVNDNRVYSIPLIREMWEDGTHGEVYIDDADVFDVFKTGVDNEMKYWVEEVAV